MEIVWTDKAKERLKENLEFWDIHNGTPSFFKLKVKIIENILKFNTF